MKHVTFLPVSELRDRRDVEEETSSIQRSRRTPARAFVAVALVVGLVLGVGSQPVSAGSGSGTAACNRTITLRDGPARDALGLALFWNEYYLNFCYSRGRVTSVYAIHNNWRLTNVSASNARISRSWFVKPPTYQRWNGNNQGAVNFRVQAEVSYGWPTMRKTIWRDVTVRANGTYSWTGWGG